MTDTTQSDLRDPPERADEEYVVKLLVPCFVDGVPSEVIRAIVEVLCARNFLRRDASGHIEIPGDTDSTLGYPNDAAAALRRVLVTFCDRVDPLGRQWVANLVRGSGISGSGWLPGGDVWVVKGASAAELEEKLARFRWDRRALLDSTPENERPHVELVADAVIQDAGELLLTARTGPTSRRGSASGSTKAWKASDVSIIVYGNEVGIATYADETSVRIREKHLGRASWLRFVELAHSNGELRPPDLPRVQSRRELANDREGRRQLLDAGAAARNRRETWRRRIGRLNAGLRAALGLAETPIGRQMDGSYVSGFKSIEAREGRPRN